jgi:hypothetical protein
MLRSCPHLGQITFHSRDSRSISPDRAGISRAMNRWIALLGSVTPRAYARETCTS